MSAHRALTRPVSEAFARCELTHLGRVPIDLDRARQQHAAYEAALESLGCEIERLPAADASPDAVFVEDTAVVLDEVAVVARPGALSRRAEVAAVASLLARYLPLARIEAPGTLDGGDVLRCGRSVFVGRSKRTSEEGIRQLRSLLERYGYRVIPVAVDGCLHLKTAVTSVGEGLLLVQPDWVDVAAFAGFETIEVDAAEPFAANALWLGDSDVIFPAAFSRTAGRLEARGLRVHRVEVSEIAKAEGGVTCCSVIVPKS